eukprot:Gb_28980 [translate_table: standard]
MDRIPDLADNFGIPKPLLYISISYVLANIRHVLYCPLRSLGLGEFPEPEFFWPLVPDHSQVAVTSSVYITSAKMIGESLPEVTCGIYAAKCGGVEEDIMCAVCLSEFERQEKIRLLSNCSHIFHKDCLDKWVSDRHQNSCPLCRSLLLPETFERDAYSWRAQRI